jgi:hypothetical protein
MMQVSRMGRRKRRRRRRRGGIFYNRLSISRCYEGRTTEEEK